MPTLVDPLIRFLVGFGLVDVVLPFVLVFAVVFGVLQQTLPFGLGRKNVHVVFALISGLLVVVSVDLLGAINRMSAFLSVVLVTGMLVMMLFGILGVQSLDKSKPVRYVLLAILFFGVLYVLGTFEFVSRRSLLEYFLPALLIFALFVVLVWGVLSIVPKKKDELLTQKSPTAKPQTKTPEGRPAPKMITPQEAQAIVNQAREIAQRMNEGEEPSLEERQILNQANQILQQDWTRQQQAQAQAGAQPRRTR